MRRSSIVSAVIFGTIFSACGCLMGYFFGQQTTLNCLWLEPMQIECNMKKNWLGLVPLSEETIRGLEGAMVGKSCDEDGCTYRVELNTADGVVPLTAFYSSGYKSKQEMADRIAAFVQEPTQDPLLVKANTGLLAYVTALIFILAGPVIVLSTLFRRSRW
jgi:hypothetical protein